MRAERVRAMAFPAAPGAFTQAAMPVMVPVEAGDE
jgi:hypothetical protein